MKESEMDSITMLQAILQTIDEGIHAVDRTGNTIYYNEAAARLDGLQPCDVIGKHVLEIFPSLKRETSTLVQVLETGEPIRNEPQTYTNYLGIKVHTMNTTLPIKSGGRMIGAVEVSKNLTELKRLSEQIVDLQARVVQTSVPSVKNKRNQTRKHQPDGFPGNQYLTAIYTFDDILTDCSHMIRLKDIAKRAANTSSPVLLYGETGTGKELFVHAIHNASERKQAPFLAQNCAALPATLLESILFGTVRGSFTGAEDRPGLFELANGGTLFLDEINSMPVELQAKLLRVLQDGNVMRIGATDIRKVDVRLITATNVRPTQLVEQQLLRADLFYRLNVVSLSLPKLVEREGDLPMLMNHFLSVFTQKLKRQVAGFHPDVRQCLMQYEWPGNVRELAHVIEGAMNIMEGDLITLDVLPGYICEQWNDRKQKCVVDQSLASHFSVSHSSIGHSSAGKSSENGKAICQQINDSVLREDSLDLRKALVQFEQTYISKALAATNGNILQAAKLLGIPRQTLQYKLGKEHVQNQVSTYQKLNESDIS